jgi:5-methyltetrahydropteroyltriglutamate--homocysteine methyltransferase
VDECVAIQERAGVDIVADGEMRRNVFASQLVQASEGFDTIQNNSVDWFRMDGTLETSPVTVGLVAPIKRKRHLSAEEFVYLRARASKPTKMTLPSPTMYAYYWVPGISEAAYPSTDAYMAAVVDILRDEVAELIRLGCEYIQFDAPEFGMLIDPHQQEWFASKGFQPERMLHDGIDMLNALIAGHSGVTFGLHVCRGNDANRYMAAGGYDTIAREVFKRSRCQRLLLEYDDARSGTFAPLAEVPDDVTVVLGLISTKTAHMETAQELRERITEASRYIPLERLALSPQCGFASVASGNHLGAVAQETKLRLVAEVARVVWDD